MRISTFIEKFKSALQSKVCLLCEEKLGTYSQFCDHCHETLGIRQPEPLLQTAISQCHAATTFNPAVKKLLYGHKFYNRLEYVSELTGLLIQYWEHCLPGLGFHNTHPENVLVLPIPPHGQNASLIDIFASCFARHFGYDYRYDV